MSEPSDKDATEGYRSAPEEQLSARRFACDRCRIHKLKCDRDVNSDCHSVCRRCSKADAICKTSSTAPIGRPAGSVRRQYERQGHRSHRTRKVALTRVRNDRIETQIPTPSSSMAGDVSEAGFVAVADNRELSTPLSSSVNSLNTANDVVSNDVELVFNGQQLMTAVSNSIPVPTSETEYLSDLFAPTLDQQEHVGQSIAKLHSDLVLDLNISRGSQRIDECAWITSMPELADSYNFLVGRMLNNSKRLHEVLLRFADIPSRHGQQNALQCDIPTMSSLLTCYIYLVRIYRYMFTSIAKSVPLLSTSTVKLPVLFPGLHLVGFSLEPHMDLQIQVLVQVAETLLQKIDKTLGMPYGLDGQSTTGLLQRTGFSMHSVHAMLQCELVEKHDDGILVGNNEPLKDIFASLRKADLAKI